MNAIKDFLVGTVTHAYAWGAKGVGYGWKIGLFFGIASLLAGGMVTGAMVAVVAGGMLGFVAGAVVGAAIGGVQEVIKGMQERRAQDSAEAQAQEQAQAQAKQAAMAQAMLEERATQRAEARILAAGGPGSCINTNGLEYDGVAASRGAMMGHTA